MAHEFTATFDLALAPHKTFIWSAEIGGRWPVHGKAKPDYPKEERRLEEACRRLDRLKAAPTHPVHKILAIEVGCLSGPQYVNLLEPDRYKELRRIVKMSLGLPWAAPEILFFCIPSSPTNPFVTWMLAGLALLPFVNSSDWELIWKRSLHSPNLDHSLGWDGFYMKP